MSDYLPIHRPGDVVTFGVTTAVSAGTPVQVGEQDRAVEPVEAGSVTYVGVAGHDAAIGDVVTVEVGKPIHELKAVGAVGLGDEVEAAVGGVRTATTGRVLGIALTAAAAGAKVQILQN